MRADIVEMLAAAGSGHPGGSLSACDIIAVLYFDKMNIDPKNVEDPDRDRFVLAKGHAAPALYAALAERGYFPREDLITLRKYGSHLQGHPNMADTPGVEMSTGSLGQGLSVANGMALAGRLDNRDYYVYCIMGDGEIQEGQVWEAAMSAGHYGLDHVIAFVDHNHLQIDGNNDEVMTVNPIEDKFRAFGWNVMTIDGHDYDAISDAVETAKATKGKPTVIVCRDRQGQGRLLHGERRGLARRGADGRAGQPSHLPSCAASNVPRIRPLQAPTRGAPMNSATREAYGKALAELAPTNPDIVALDADLSGTTKSADMGIAEADMVGTAAGLATCGKIPFASTFSVFATCRALDQIRNSICYPHLNVKVVGTHAGPSCGEDGGSHQAVEDIAIMRSLPNMTVVVPADDVEA